MYVCVCVCVCEATNSIKHCFPFNVSLYWTEYWIIDAFLKKTFLKTIQFKQFQLDYYQNNFYNKICLSSIVTFASVVLFIFQNSHEL